MSASARIRAAKRHLVAVADRVVPAAAEAAAGGVDASTPRAFSSRAKATVSSSVTPSRRAVDRRRPGRRAAVVGPGGAHGLDHLEREAHAVLARAAVPVLAPVGQRREELVEQVAVRGVHLDDVEAGGQGAPGGGDERLAHLGQLVDGQRVRGRASPAPTGTALADTVGHGSSPGRAFSAVTGPSPSQGALLLALAPAWASWMPARRPVRVQEVDHPGQAGHVLVGPQADVAVADPALGGDPGGLDDDEPEAAQGEPAQVRQVVVADEAVGHRVLAHAAPRRAGWAA